MNKQNYKLSFLPLFEEYLLEITNYITNTLQNPSAAHRLVDDIELAINKKLKMPLMFSLAKTIAWSLPRIYPPILSLKSIS